MTAIDDALALLAGREAVGEGIFAVAAKALSVGLGWRWCGIAELAEDGASARVIAFHGETGEPTPGGYDLVGGPSESIYADPNQPHWFVAEGAAERYPADPMLRDLGAESYRAEVFFGPSGKPIGHVFAFHDRPMSDDAEIRTFFRLVSQRIGAECNRLHSERALRESEARLQGLIDNAPFAVLFKDLDGRYVLVNRQWESWTSNRFEDIRGRFPDAALDQELAAFELTKDLQVLRHGQTIVFEIEANTDGSPRTYLETKFPVRDAGGTLLGLGNVVADITARKRAERLLQRQIEEAEESSSAKTRFLAVASHDLRQPLHSLELMVDILARQVAEPTQRELVRDIAQAVDIAAGLLNPLLDFSRLEAGMVEPEIEDFAIAGLLRDMDVGFIPSCADCDS